MRKRKKVKIPKIVIGVFVTVFIVSLMWVAIDMATKPMIRTMATYKINAFVTELVHQSVSEILNLSKDNNMVIINRDVNGNVTDVSANMFAINSFKADINTRILSEMSTLENYSIKIPFASVFGGFFIPLSKMSINYDLLPQGFVETSIISSMTASGVNQGYHRIILKVYADITAIAPFYSLKIPVTTDFVLSETVIVGHVPDTYVNVLSKENLPISKAIN